MTSPDKIGTFSSLLKNFNENVWNLYNNNDNKINL